MPQTTTPDDRLAVRASRGDQRALAAIFRRYHQDLYRYCVAIVGNPEDAQDALQNTMVKLLSALPGERRRVRLKPWLYRIAHNEAVEILRKRKPVDPLVAEDLVGAPGTDSTAEARERLRHLVSDLGELPHRQRGALLMRELGGLSFAQIGSALDTSAAAARQALYEARLALREVERGREMECEEVRRKLSDGDRRVLRRRDVRTHLRYCAGCREFDAAIALRRKDLGAIAPLPALAAVGILKGVVGAAGAVGGAAGTGGAVGIGGVAGAGPIGVSTAVKAVATVAAAGAIGVSAADRADLIHVYPRSDHGDAPAAVESESRTGPSPSPAGLPAAVREDGGSGGGGAVGGGTTVDAARDAGGSEHGGESNGKPAKAKGESGPPGSSPHPGRDHRAHPTPPEHSKSGGKGTGKANAHGGNANADAKAGVPHPKGGNAGKGAQGGQSKAAPETPPVVKQPTVPPGPADPAPGAPPREKVESGPPTDRGKPGV